MHQKFLDQVVDEILPNGQDPENLIFVLPSRRSGTFLKNAIVRKLSRTVFAPQIYSIEEFIELISGLQYASKTEQLFTLYESYLALEDKNKESFLEFAKWASTLLSDFDEIDRYLIPHEKVFSYLSAITELSYWENERTPLMEAYLAFWNKLEPLYMKFRELQLAKGKGHQGLVYRTATEKLKEYKSITNDKRHIFIGFNALNASESHIIQNLLDETDAHIYWDLDQYFLDETYHDAGYFIRNHIKNWNYLRQKAVLGIGKNYLNPKQIEIIGVPKQVSQVKYMGTLLEQLAKGQTDDFRNTAVILADESLLNPLLNSIPPSVNKANITMGFPLKNTSLSSFFYRYIELYAQNHVRGWQHKKVLSFLTQPYLQNMLSEEESSSLSDLKSELYSKNLLFLTIEQIKSLKGEIWTLLFNKANFKVPYFIESCLQIVSRLKRAMEDSDVSDLELESLYGFYTLFNQLKELTKTHAYITDIPTLSILFNELLAQTSIDFQGEPTVGLQIMGMLESRVLDFETVIISSVNEGIIPAGKQGNSFIPYDVKRELGLPTYKEKDSIYTYHFYRLLQRAKSVYLIYNTEPDVLLGGEPSRLIHQLRADPNISPYITEKVASMAIGIDRARDKAIPKDKKLMQAISAYGGKGFSPTSLALYIRNPIEFYKKIILKIEEAEEIEEVIAAKTFGTVIHNVLEELYTPLVNKVLSEEVLRRLLPEIPGIVKKHFARFYDKDSIGRGRNLIAFQVLVRYIENFISSEIEAVKQMNVKILALEKDISMKIDIPHLTFPVHLRGKIDRIDEVDGSLRILDYKTGRVSISEMNVVHWEDLIQKPELSKVFQVLCYAYMYMNSENINSLEAGVFSFKNMKDGFISFATKEKMRSRIRATGVNNEVITKFEKELHSLILEICNPDIPFTDKSQELT